jgi:hypothetical protein
MDKKLFLFSVETAFYRTQLAGCGCLRLQLAIFTSAVNSFKHFFYIFGSYRRIGNPEYVAQANGPNAVFINQGFPDGFANQSFGQLNTHKIS